ncbi:MAG: hypothetical protein JWN04_4434 [Myxococcaceae bacterium]|nr:hypothetical protein [Myxococcaceae bacterium]
MKQLASYRHDPSAQAYAALLGARFAIATPPPAQERFQAVCGHDVHIDEYQPVGPARGTIILVHGGGGHGRLLSPFVAPVLAQGFRVCAPDLPGYGLTRLGKAAHYDHWSAVVAALAEQASSHGPVFLFGLSVGGVTALRAAQRTNAVRGVMCTTLIDLRNPDSFDLSGHSRRLGRVTRWLFRSLGGLLDWLRVPLYLLAPLAKMSSDRDVTRLLRNDPLIGKRWVSLGLVRSFHQYAPPRDDYHLPCPLLLVHPGSDLWTPVSMSMPVFDAIPSEKQLVILSNGAHAPLESPAYGELCAQLKAFLDRHAPNAP